MTSLDPTLFEKARSALSYSYSPYSRFPVSCCIKTTTGKYYTGANIENASYSLALCAEAVAIAHMVHQGEKKIAEIFVIGPGEALCTPCGACRQRIREFANDDTLIHIGDHNGHRATFTLGELLPHSFGPHNLEQAHD
jgi:cytidine deaminase